MNCWKSLDMDKEHGKVRLYIISLFISLFTFMFLYVPSSIYHHHFNPEQKAMIPFFILLLALPTIHSVTHILPCLYMPKKTGITLKWKFKTIPIFYFYTKVHLPKKRSILIALAPTLLLTIPGLVTIWAVKEWYVYATILTSIHIGISFKDYLYLIYLFRAPKYAFISNQKSAIDILIKTQ